jgi:aspartyl-tRNA(Asn)/glutamyl-tRNA(Gln) amidotransferase subunit A
MHDSPAVHRLRHHGAVLIGKMTTPEFGWKAVTDSPLTGISRNPWNTALSPGGSSGGSAAAIASGMTPLALGTDGGGSIRIPSSFCGVVGIKPTFGRVAQWPSSPFGTLSHVGPMAWTVADAAALLQVISGSDPLDPSSCFLPALGDDVTWGKDLRGLRIALSHRLGYVKVDKEVADAVSSAATVLEALGAIVTEADPGFTDPIATFEVLWYVGAARAVEPYAAGRREQMDCGLIEVAEIGSAVSALDYLQATEVQSKLNQLMSRFFLKYDLLVTPTMPIVAFPAGQEVPDGWPRRRWMSWTPFTYPFNMSGIPAVTVPCGFNSAGLPIGLQFLATRHADWLAISSARAYQQAAPLTQRRPTWVGEPQTACREQGTPR